MNAPVISDVTSAGLLSRRLTTDLAAPQRLWWELIGSLFERYRPELHYARGDPGLFSVWSNAVFGCGQVIATACDRICSLCATD